MTFSYVPYQEGHDTLYRPEVVVIAIGHTGEASFSALVDTGSDETLLPRDIGEAIGADIDPNHTATAIGLGGQPVEVIMGKLTLELTQGSYYHTWTARVGFIDQKHGLALLGHRGFLDYFKATFHGDLHQLQIVPTQKT